MSDKSVERPRGGQVTVHRVTKFTSVVPLDGWMSPHIMGVCASSAGPGTKTVRLFRVEPEGGGEPVYFRKRAEAREWVNERETLNVVRVPKHNVECPFVYRAIPSRDGTSTFKLIRPLPMSHNSHVHSILDSVLD